MTESIADTELQAGDTTTATITVTMIKTPIENEATTSITGILTVSPIDNSSATGTIGAQIMAGAPESFATDSWATIGKAVRDNNTSMYEVGDTKKVTINNIEYTLRLVNKSSHDWCNNESYSETACGFVVEFAEIVEKRVMNSTDTNVGGWPGSDLHTYLEGDFYNSLPSDLKVVIEPTRVVSGYGCKGKVAVSNNKLICDNYNYDNNGNNFESMDKLFLLSGVEVFGSDSYDSAASTTTILDYYKQSNSTKRKIIVNSTGNNDCWWLRSTDSIYNNVFAYVDTDEVLEWFYSTSTYVGVSPAFRIG